MGNVSPKAVDSEQTESDGSFTEVLSKSKKKKLRKSRRLAKKSEKLKAQGRAGLYLKS